MKLKRISFFMFVAIVSLLVIAPRFAKADNDTTPPVITAPADQNFATTTFPAFPELVPATATDDTDPNPIITYSPLSFSLGTTQVIWTATDLAGNFATTTSNVTLTEPIEAKVSLTIRDGGTTAFSGNINLPDIGAPDIFILPTSGTTSPVAVSPRSVLGILESLEATTSAFNITNLSYSDAFGSFLINCIAIPLGSSTPECFNWTDAINGLYPQVGVDHQMLNDGDVVYLFFGSPRKTVISKDSVAVGESFTATAQEYDLLTGNYLPLANVTLGVGTLNADFSFTEMATSTSDTNGQAIFSLSNSGKFSVGIKEDYYFPSVDVSVTDAPSGGGGVGGSGGSGITHSQFNIPLALDFLKAQQRINGSFDDNNSSFYSDWAAIAYGALGESNEKNNLKNYMLNASPSMESITDYERHAMALEALGINPYSGTKLNYISPIVNAFSGTQIISDPKDTDQYNDDIFGVFSLLYAGYSPSDSLMQKEAAFIISKQEGNGSWGSPDMTAAAAQALGVFFGSPSFSPQRLGQVLAKAQQYLQTTELADASWGSVDSTSWVLSMINSTYESDSAHAIAYTSSSGYVPLDAIAGTQQSDGAVRPFSDTVNNRIWSTSYALAAASGKSWLTILKPFSRPKQSEDNWGVSAGLVLGVNTSTPLTLISTQATSTPQASTTVKTILISEKIPALSQILQQENITKIKTIQQTKKQTTKISQILEKVNESEKTALVISKNESAKIGVRKKITNFFGDIWNNISAFLGKFF